MHINPKVEGLQPLDKTHAANIFEQQFCIELVLLLELLAVCIRLERVAAVPFVLSLAWPWLLQSVGCVCWCPLAFWWCCLLCQGLVWRAEGCAYLAGLFTAVSSVRIHPWWG